MLTADELQGLRSDMTDDEILEGVRKHSPDLQGDIESLRGEGFDPKTILDGIAKHGAAPQQADPMDNMGALEKTRKAVQYSAANRLTGLGRTGHYLGADQYGAKAVEDFGKSLAPDNYRPASADFFDPQEKDKGVGGFGWGYAPRAALEGAAGLGMDLGVGALTGGVGFLASNAAGNFGTKLDERMANQAPGATPSLTDYGAAAANTGLNAYLNKLGLKGGLGLTGAAEEVAKGAGLKALGQIPVQVAKAGAQNAAEGYVGSVVDQTGRTAGTDHGLDINTHEALGSAGLAGETGAAVRALRAPGDVNNAIKNRNVDAEAGTRVADELAKTGKNLEDPKESFQAMKLTEASLNERIKTAKAKSDEGAGHLIEERGAGEDVNTAIAHLKQGSTLTDEQWGKLKSTLGDRGDGVNLLNALKDRAELNRLKGRGTWDDNSKEFAGGISGRFANWIDPRKTAGRLLGAGAVASTGAQYAVPFLSQFTLGSGFLAKALAAQGGVYGAARGIDNVLGNRNPAHEFTQRFKGLQETAPNDLPTTQGIRGAEEADQQQLDWDHQQAIAENSRRTQAQKALQKTVAAGEKDARKADDRQYDRDYKNALEINRQRQFTEKALEKTVNDGKNLKAKNDAFEARKAEMDRKNAEVKAERDMKQAVTEGQAEKVKRDTDTAKAQKALEKLAKAGEANLGKVNLPPTGDFGAGKTVKAMKAAEKLASKPEKAEAPRSAPKASKGSSEAPKGSPVIHSPSEGVIAANYKDSSGEDFSAVEAQERNGNWYISGAELPEDMRGKGLGTAAYEKLVDEALKRGGAVFSDGEVSPDAKRIYDSLKRKGYRVEQMPGARQLDGEGGRWVADEAGPVFKITGKGEPDVKAQAQKAKVAKDAREKVSEPKGSKASNDPETITIKHGNYSVQRPRKGIDNFDAYISATKRNLKVRADFAKDLKEAIPDKAETVDGLIELLNNQSKSDGDATEHMTNWMNEGLSDSQVDAAIKVMQKHRNALKGTYGKAR